MGNDGKQKYATQYYSLDAILSVGYRVNSKNSVVKESLTAVAKFATTQKEGDRIRKVFKEDELLKELVWAKFAYTAPQVASLTALL